MQNRSIKQGRPPLSSLSNAVQLVFLLVLGFSVFMLAVKSLEAFTAGAFPGQAPEESLKDVR